MTYTFWQMGGYATYVWSAYGIVLLIFLCQLFVVKKKLNRLRKLLSRKYAQSS